MIETRDMDMSANDTVVLTLFGMTHKSLFEFTDELNGLLRPDFDARAEPAFFQSEPSPHAVDGAVCADEPVIRIGAQRRQPPGSSLDVVELITVENKESTAVGRLMDELVRDTDQTEVMQIVAQKFIVIPRRVVNPGSVRGKLHQPSMKSPTM